MLGGRGAGPEGGPGLQAVHPLRQAGVPPREPHAPPRSVVLAVKLAPDVGVLVFSVCAFLHYLQICAVRTGIVWMPRILVSGI